MSTGTLLIGLGVALVVAAYISRPFRMAALLDRDIEAWVRQARAEPDGFPPAKAGAGRACPQCGQIAAPDHHFCRRCGTRLLIGLLTVLWLAAVPATTYAQAPGPIVISGQVVNGTPGGSLPAGQPVTLHLFSETAQQVQMEQSALSPEGTFRFEVRTEEEVASFAVAMRHQGVLYTTEPTPLEADSEDHTVELILYDATESAEAVIAGQVHLFVVPTGDTLQVTEYYVLSNAGTKTYVGMKDAATDSHFTLAFSLPEQARNVHVEGADVPEGRYRIEETAILDTAPLLPGEITAEVRFTYDLPAEAAQPLRRTFPIPVQTLVLVAGDGALNLEGAGLTPMGADETGAANAYLAGPLAAGEPLEFTVEHTGATNVPVRRAPTQELGIGMLALAASLALSYRLWQPGPRAMPEAARPFVAALARLDAQHEAGALPEAAYAQERAALKTQIKSLIEVHNGSLH